MPTYDYVCRACGHRLEVHHGLYVDGPTQCPNCHSHALRKAIAAPAVVFKGSGWAKKDRSQGTSTKAAASDAAASDAAGPSGTASGEGAKGGETAKGGAPAKGGVGSTDAATAPTSSAGSNPASGVD
jgi:putative FmdB family regulatory protein